MSVRPHENCIKSYLGWNFTCLSFLNISIDTGGVDVLVVAEAELVALRLDLGLSLDSGWSHDARIGRES